MGHALRGTTRVSCLRTLMAVLRRGPDRQRGNHHDRERTGGDHRRLYIKWHRVLEKRWRYDITNTSSSGDINNMIEWHVNAGSNNNVLAITKNHSGTGTINLFTNSSSSGFTGLLPPASGIPNNNKVSIFLYTPATTGTAAGEAGATARADGLFRRHHADNPGGGTRHRGPAAAQRLDGCRRLSRVLPGAAG